MGNILGAVFFALCCFVAICVWGINVIYVDNALPQILSNLTNTFDSITIGGFNPVGWIQLFITLERYSPLFIVFFGGVGWFVEAYILGRRDTYYASSNYRP